MTAAFAIHIFYPDGGPPESGLQRIDALSEKWLSICRGLFEWNGPIFNYNMGSTLSHFDVEFAGPIFKLRIHRQLCFEVAITSGDEPQQDSSTIAYFREKLASVVALSGGNLSESASATMGVALAHPSVLVIDQLVEDVADDQMHALIQLGYHFAGAYYEYLAHNDRRTNR